MIPISVAFEQALWDTRDSADKRAAFLEATGAKSVLPKLIVQGYKELGLIFFFTAGEKEVRCWTIQDGWLAPQARCPRLYALPIPPLEMRLRLLRCVVCF